MGLIHRDDLPFEVAEELVKQLQKDYPGKKIVFAGDVAGVDQEIEELINSITLRQLEHIVEGYCFDCGAVFPRPWPPEGDGPLPKGWTLYENIGSDDTRILICPKCDT
jgi:hypothetical protein